MGQAREGVGQIPPLNLRSHVYGRDRLDTRYCVYSHVEFGVVSPPSTLLATLPQRSLSPTWLLTGFRRNTLDPREALQLYGK